ncbi:MAG: hypothetical protein KCHDKBKB_02004 [Elusimicrobia bacterium]|nr:hypothetical protein [Elusimicrobiota bacterium]
MNTVTLSHFNKEIGLTYQDLDGRFRRLALEIIKNSHDIRDMKVVAPILSEMRENLWHVLNRLDALERKSP